MLKLDRVFFALGLIGLGILSLVYGDFALQWQPVPAWVPGRTYLAYASGVVMIAGGTGLLSRRTAVFSSGVLLVYMLLWLLLLKLPHVVMAPQVEVNWLGFGEIAVIVAGAWVLFAVDRGHKESSRLKFATGESGMRMAQLLFGVALIPVGLSHFVYARETIGFVPTWLPFRHRARLGAARGKGADEPAQLDGISGLLDDCGCCLGRCRKLGEQAAFGLTQFLYARHTTFDIETKKRLFECCLANPVPPS